jgi:hypothetical protein
MSEPVMRVMNMIKDDERKNPEAEIRKKERFLPEVFSQP